MIEFGGTGSSRNNEERGGNGTLEAVRRSVDNGEFIVAGLSCNVGGGTATVKVNCFYTACFKHDLCDFLHTTAAGEGFLTSIENHHNDLTGLRDTDSRTACTVIGIVIIMFNYNFTLFYKGCTEACDTFLYLSLINRVVFFCSTDDGSTVLQNTKEAVRVDFVIFNTAHDEQAAGFTGRHIEARAVGRCNYLVVGNIQGTGRIAVLILSGICLIQNALHFPTLGGVVIVIVCVEVNVVSGDIRSCDIVSHLLTVSRCSVLDFLRNTGSESGHLAGEYRIIMVFFHINVVARELTDITCERVANCTSERNEILRTGKVSRTFESGDELVGKIFCINSASYMFARAVGLQSVCHEVSCTIFIIEILVHIVHDDLS